MKITRKCGESISPEMIGLFFEDINFAADGGLYAEMIENRSFEAKAHTIAQTRARTYCQQEAWGQVTGIYRSIRLLARQIAFEREQVEYRRPIFCKEEKMPSDNLARSRNDRQQTYK